MKTREQLIDMLIEERAMRLFDHNNAHPDVYRSYLSCITAAENSLKMTHSWTKQDMSAEVELEGK